MKRRDFFKSLAVVSASLFIPKLPDAFKWKASRKSGTYVPNPEYLDAPFECGFVFHANAYAALPIRKQFQPIIFKREEGVDFIPPGKLARMQETFPTRFTIENGVYRPIPPMKKLAM